MKDIKKIIEDAMIELGKTRKVFYSEDDFKLSLGLLLSKQFKDNIRLEIPQNITYNYLNYGGEKRDSENKCIYIDLFINGKDKYAIELKYKTKKIELNYNDEDYKLKNQSALDAGRYKFRADIFRLEYLKNANKIKNGFAIFLTNDSAYWNSEDNKKKTMDIEFRLSGEKITKKAKWNLDNERLKTNYNFKDGIWVSKKNTKNKIWIYTQEFTKDLSLKKEYEIDWKDFSEFPNENCKFKYLNIEV